MGDFDDGMEMGLWGDDGIPYSMDETEENITYDIKRRYVVNKDETFRYLDVMLTPINLLKSDERYARASLYKEYDTFKHLELIHDRDNEHDNKALSVFVQRIFIGYIRKTFTEDDITINNSYIVDKFCFKDGHLKNVNLIWDGDKFYLRQKTEEAIEKEIKKKVELEVEKKRLKVQKDIEQKTLDHIEEIKQIKITFLKKMLDEFSNDIEGPTFLEEIHSMRHDDKYKNPIHNFMLKIKEYINFLNALDYGEYRTDLSMSSINRSKKELRKMYKEAVEKNEIYHHNKVSRRSNIGWVILGLLLLIVFLRNT